MLKNNLYNISIAVNSPLKTIFTYTYPNKDEIMVGQMVEVFLGNSRRRGIVIAIDVEYKLDYELKPIEDILDYKPLLNKDLIELAYKIADYYFCSLGEVLFAMLPNSMQEKEVNIGLTNDELKPVFNISLEQQSAIAKINSKIDTYYLHGLTGSGKTVVFIELIKEHLKAGGSVIYLVPEISLTYQTVALFKHFFTNFSVINSSLTPSQRLKEWRLIQSGENRLVIGTRSAIFAPVNNLTLIIIDEEHDPSYKSQATPRFHARQVAMMRKQMHNSTLVMGSATPSLESFASCKNGAFNLVELKNRYSNIKPNFKIVDMKQEKSIFSKELVNEVLKTKALGKQTILFLNRKGFSKYFICSDCETMLECPHCSVALTYHQSKNKLICHYCGYQDSTKKACSKCGSLNIEFKAFGLEMVKEEADKFFAHLKIDYIDGDVVRQKNKNAKEIINNFKNGTTDLLLATQVVAKGFNFKNLRLIGVVLADVGLAMPDFRSEERTFAMLEQIAGRSARFGDEGLVIVQSYRPNNLVIESVVQQDFTNFYNIILKQREEANFPPFTRLIKIVFRGKKELQVSKEALKFASEIEAYINNEEIEILGPIEAPIKKIADVYRYQVLMRGQSYNHLKHVLNLYLIEKTDLPNTVYREIDGDPVSLL